MHQDCIATADLPPTRGCGLVARGTASPLRPLGVAAGVAPVLLQSDLENAVGASVGRGKFGGWTLGWALRRAGGGAGMTTALNGSSAGMAAAWD